MTYNIDFDSLREDLIDYFGTAMIVSSPIATIALTKIENANEDELIKIAKENNFDLNKYNNNLRHK